MFDNEEQFIKWIKENFPYKEKSEEEIKKELIEEFGIDKYNQMEAEVRLDKLNISLCDYLGIEPVPIIFEDIKEDARYYDKKDYIAINKKFMFDEIESIKCLIHEVRHCYQKYTISHKKDKLIFAPIALINEWKKEFKQNQLILSPSNRMCQAIEIDAYAFTKYILKKWLYFEYHHLDKTYDEILDLYISKYYK